MTGFATRPGQHGGWSWTWDIRSVNGRGLDIRLRLPDGIDGLEALVRQAVQKRVARGNVTVSLKLQGAQDGAAARLDQAGLETALGWLAEVSATAERAGVALAPPSCAEILALRGVLDTEGATVETAQLRDALMADLAHLLEDFDAMRRTEGEALAGIVSGQVATVAGLVREARALEPERNERARKSLSEALARVMETAAGADPDRVAQELAILAVKSDIAEELDRLDAHVEAAQALLNEAGTKGRKLDFLTQEFNREANTLCAKAQYAPLTRIGLDMKHAIDQMREQVQNIE